MSQVTMSDNFEGKDLTQRAFEMAQSASFKIGYHEQLCSERYHSIDKTMQDILTSLRGLWRIVLIAAGTLILGMSGILAHQIFH